MPEDYEYLLPPELEDPLKWLDELLKQQQKEREALIVHHTGGSTLDSALNALKSRGLTGYNWFVDPQGELIPNPLVAEGGFGEHMRPGQGAGAGLSNRNTFGISAIAPDESSVTPEQIAAIKAFSEVRGFDPQSVFGHGEVNPHKDPDEGMAIINAIRNIDPLAATAAAAMGGEDWPTPPPSAATGTRKMGLLDELYASLTGEQGSAAQASGGSLAAMLGLAQPAQQQQQGGFDPETMGYLAMIAKGLSPYSALEPQQMLAQAQRQKETRELAAQRQAEARQNLLLRLGESQRAQEATLEQRREAQEERKRAATVQEQIRRDALVPSSAREVEVLNRDRATRGEPPLTMEEGLARVEELKNPARKDLSATQQNILKESQDRVFAAQTAIGALKEAKTLSPNAQYGPLVLERAEANAAMGNKAGEDTLLMNNIIQTNAIEQLKLLFGGQPTEGERKVLLELQGSVRLPPKVREAIWQRAIEAAEKRMEFNARRAESIGGGTFGKPETVVTPPTDRLPDPWGIR